MPRQETQYQHQHDDACSHPIRIIPFEQTKIVGQLDERAMVNVYAIRDIPVFAKVVQSPEAICHGEYHGRECQRRKHLPAKMSFQYKHQETNNKEKPLPLDEEVEIIMQSHPAHEVGHEARQLTSQTVQ